MSKSAYTFQVLKYSHDPAAGEILNIGVILFCPDLSFLEIAVDHKFERLSNAFAGFDGDGYRYTVRRFESAVERAKEGAERNLFGQPFNDVSDITAQVWPDVDLSIKLGSVLSGVTDNPEITLQQIFERMVLSQCLREEKQARTDDEVWNTYKKPLVQRQISLLLTPKAIETPEFKIQFEHAFKNDAWHVLQPISLDLTRTDSIQRKAALWLGTGTALRNQPELGTMFLLLGRPHLKSIMPAYEKAKSLLNKIPVKHEIVEEDEAERFALEFETFIRNH